MNIPFVDLAAQYSTISREIDTALQSFKKFSFLFGPELDQLSTEICMKWKTDHVIPTANGTDSLFISLKCLGVGNGDEVITPAFSCLPSAEVIDLCGARPVFVDVHEAYFTLDPAKIENRITPRTKAIIAVHLFGQAAEVSEILAVCNKFHLDLIEDCAQAHLTQYSGRNVGTYGTTGAFSFYPTKNLGAYGDAGCIMTKDDALAEHMRRFANHGARNKNDHELLGINSRMDTVQAAILLAKLPHLEHWNKKRQLNATLYTELLSAVREYVAPPVITPNGGHTFHIYAIRAKRRDELKAFLAARGIQTMIHYPYALHNLPAYQYLGYKPADFPVADRLQNELLSLPIYPELTHEQIEYVCSSIKDFYTTHKA